jgi:hypothetical protein
VEEVGCVRIVFALTPGEDGCKISGRGLIVKVTGEVSPLWPTVADWLWFLISWRQILGVRNNGMVARELPLGPARLPCIYMVFAPYLTSLSVRNSYYTHITAIPLQLHSFIPTSRCRLSSYPNTGLHSRCRALPPMHEVERR